MTPMYFQAVHAFNATTSGALLVPCSMFGVLCTVGAGVVIKRTGKYFALVILAQGLLVCAVLLLALGFWQKIAPAEVGGLLLSMAGGGSALSGLLIAQLAHSMPQDTAVVVASSYLFRTLGGIIGISIGSAVMQQILRQQLAVRLPDSDQARHIAEKVIADLDYLRKLEPGVADQVRTSYRYGLLGATGPSLAFALLALVVSFMVKEKRLSK
ncbi:hypothetical protein HIM_07913 [Hirsutella minnesotensis 3608]|uniref:Major facilitator superfamily (MFS) profile domain-containing protein n=1 Tax=Hirsutella minnesotensis 3608 TaxID=1043627 RepID=A0A0F7ZHI9_9HYPO|nr:hypothetical protein HIM_07913 [Hirsutella minnesotensis 3608]